MTCRECEHVKYGACHHAEGHGGDVSDLIPPWATGLQPIWCPLRTLTTCIPCGGRGHVTRGGTVASCTDCAGWGKVDL